MARRKHQEIYSKKRIPLHHTQALAEFSSNYTIPTSCLNFYTAVPSLLPHLHYSRILPIHIHALPTLSMHCPISSNSIVWRYSSLFVTNTMSSAIARHQQISSPNLIPSQTAELFQIIKYLVCPMSVLC